MKSYFSPNIPVFAFTVLTLLAELQEQHPTWVVASVSVQGYFGNSSKRYHQLNKTKSMWVCQY